MSLIGGDLTTLNEAQAYLNSPPNQRVLSGLITRVSRQILTILSRTVLIPHAVTQQFDGSGTRQLVLPHYPVIGSTLTSLTISGVNIPISPQISNTANNPTFTWGYRFQPWNGVPPGQAAVIELIGYWFQGGHQNVVVSYQAGYQVTGEVPTNANYQPLSPFGNWATDQGVTYANGTPLTATTGNSPGVGQYVPPAPEAFPPVDNYWFNPADVTAGLLISYGYVPADLEQAALDLIALKAARRQRPGVRSRSLAGQESLNYDLAGIPADIMCVLEPYISPIPPAMGASV